MPRSSIVDTRADIMFIAELTFMLSAEYEPLRLLQGEQILNHRADRFVCDKEVGVVLPVAEDREVYSHFVEVRESFLQL